MGVVIGLVFASGILLVFSAFNAPEPQAHTTGVLVQKIRSNSKLILVSVLCGAAGAAGTFIVVKNWIFACLIGVCCSLIPRFHRATTERKKRTQAREYWPDILDDVVSGLRAGLSIGESLASLSQRGPQEMRQHFSAFADELQATARLDSALNRLKKR